MVRQLSSRSESLPWHYPDVIMGAMASQITSLTIVYLTFYSGADQRKQQSSLSLAFVRGIHRWPVNSLHKWPSNAENVSIWWCHHDEVMQPCLYFKDSGGIFFAATHLVSGRLFRHRSKETSKFRISGFCVGNSPVTCDFSTQIILPLSMMTSSIGSIFCFTGPFCEFTSHSFDVSFDLRLNKGLSKQSWGWWFETSSVSLWHHCNG